MAQQAKDKEVEQTTSFLLKEKTKENHKIAESCPIFMQIVRKNVSKETYASYIVALYHVYCVLEEQLENHKDNSVLKEIYMPEKLFRKESLEEDLGKSAT